LRDPLERSTNAPFMVPTRTITSPFFAETCLTFGMVLLRQICFRHFIGRTLLISNLVLSRLPFCGLSLNSPRLMAKIVRFIANNLNVSGTA
jgi:hypothetical protein